MCLHFLSALLLFVMLCCGASGGATLRVCADPDNLPFSNAKQQGFENRLAELLARDLHQKLEYSWQPQHKNFLRNGLNAGQCDVVPGVPSGADSVWTTAPYYRSSYVFVYRKDRKLRIRSLDDAVLRKLRIGVNVVGDDYVPPAMALARRGIRDKLRGYSLVAGAEDGQARLVRAVEKGEVDVGIAWGPAAGYYARLDGTRLAIVPVSPEREGGVPFAFSIAMGVRKGDTGRKAALESVLHREHARIEKILASYGIPLQGGE